MPAEATIVIRCVAVLAAGFLPDTSTGSKTVSDISDPSPATKPLLLTEAYRSVAAHATEILLARERIHQAEIDLSRAWALLKPSWTASFTYTHSEPAPPRFEFPALPNFASDDVRTACPENLPIEAAEACLAALFREVRATANREPTVLDFARSDTAIVRSELRWNVLNARALPLIANAKDNTHLERQRFRSDELKLLLEVARVFYAAAGTQRAIEPARRAVERAEDQQRLARGRAEVGEEPRARLLATEIGLRQARIDLDRAETAHAQALNALAFATSLPVAPHAVVEPPEPVEPAGTQEDLIRGAIDRRDDLRAAAIALRIAERTHTEAWLRFAPTIALFGSVRWSNVAGISGQHEEWAAGLVASMLLYDGGLRYEDIREAESRIRSAELSLERLRQATRTNVRQAKLRLDGARLSVARWKETVALANEKLALERTQLVAGVGRAIELREADDAVKDAEVGLIRAESERALAILELQHAAGLFEPVEGLVAAAAE